MATARQNRQDQTIESRDAILEAASRLFAEKGFASTSTRAIAKAANVSTGLVFHYYPTKLDLFREVAIAENTLFAKTLELLQSSPSLSAHQFAQHFQQLFIELLAPGNISARLFWISLTGSGASSEMDELFTEANNNLITSITSFLDTQKEQGELAASADTNAAAWNFLGGFLWIFMSLRFQEEKWIENATPLTDRHVAFWYNSIRA
ncbi:MAG: hypothetical protein CMF31_06530 [Kordiimonas sp.]|nr:hypothetical protein [Kordiimonas sp.]|tara:strand:- start:1301 stop:1921 length:621 start_codon:yes stop_codon:yes gene_type:complete